MTDEEFRALQAASAQFPMFLVPVPKGGGYVNFVWQAQGSRFAYSTVEQFQSATAAVDLGLSFYEDQTARVHTLSLQLAASKSVLAIA
eukprot:2476892-Amphidinium_carterae.1